MVDIIGNLLCFQVGDDCQEPIDLEKKVKFGKETDQETM